MRWVALAWVGCVGTTGGERVTFQAQVVPVAPVDADGVLRWTDEDGWDVAVHEAVVWVGPVYLWTDEPFLQVGWLDRLLPTAHAGVDHFEAGFLTGEVTRQVRVDLLAGPADLGEGVGIAGPSRSGEVWLEPVAGGAQLVLDGVAARDGVEVPFRIELDYGDTWFDVEAGEDPVVLRRVRGILWDAVLADGGAVRVEVDARQFVRGLPYDTLVEPLVAPDTVAGRVVLQRTREAGADRSWRLKWVP